ncbi:MAG TPA: hypothetical protein PK095_23275, partial [Myxococcota bacterium]|nr:hypothetical protein [Myxococcota bacterium]
GNAGGGGGGCGGPSYGIAGPGIPVGYGTSNTFPLSDATLTSGTGGAGGLSAGSGAASAGSRGESRNLKVY